VSAGAPSPILAAVYRGDRTAVDGMLAAGARLTLCEAAAVGDAARIRQLVAGDPGALGTPSPDGWPPLHLAAYFGHGDAVDALLDARADVHARSTNSHGNTALHAAAAGRGDVRILSRLLARGADVNAVEPTNYRPLHLVAERGDVTLIETLLAHGADASARASDGKTALAVAEERGHTLAARRLRGEMP
jgi:ankyrin repeat protein